ncbi:MAG TPA: DUF1232 domain-containing protein [Gallionella sp.]|nr:DUF1232 domain-containing protein [Gallionella sp.]
MKYLRFLHIPKTAGVTFNTILERQYRGEMHFHFEGHLPSDKKRFDSLRSSVSNGILFTGHAPISTGIAEADEATLITFLRDPVSRVKSYCQHVSEGKSPHLLEGFSPETFDLDHFLFSGDSGLSNLQTRMLVCGDEWASPSALDGMSSANARDQALENLFHRVAHFGLQEYYDESLVLFSSLLAWKTPLYFSHNRKNSGRQLQFEPRHIARIEELNAVDIELYNRVEEHFVALLERSLDRRKLQQFHIINGTLNGIVGPARFGTAGFIKDKILSEPRMARLNDRLWDKIVKHARRVGSKLIKEALCLYYTAISMHTPTLARLSIVLGLLYFISPVDAVPDPIPGFGYTDDLAIILFLFKRLNKYILEPAIESARRQQAEVLPEAN